jgi:hypothetical protein
MNNSNQAKLIRCEDGQADSNVCGIAEQIAARAADSLGTAQSRSLALAFQAQADAMAQGAELFEPTDAPGRRAKPRRCPRFSLG